MSRAIVPLCLVTAMAATALVFYLDPGLDLAVAGLFYRGDNLFSGQTPLGVAARRVLYWTPTAVLLLYAALALARRFGWISGWAPSARGLAFLVLSFAIGPGLLVNTVLKDHSHRPRPYQTQQFGGDEAFRPFYRFDGTCVRNCSFVSGEGAAGAWTLAPALLAPVPIRAAAFAASAVFALAVGLLRMAFGGHYLSDTLFAFLFVWAVIWALWSATMRPALRRTEPDRHRAPPKSERTDSL